MVDNAKLKNVATKYGLVLVLIFVCTLFSMLSDVFLTSKNIFNILRQVAVIGITSVGMTFVILTAGIDLSVGSVIAVSGVVTATLIVDFGIPWPIAGCIGVAISIGFGFLTGFLINVIKIPPLITTLGMLTALRGLAFTITSGLPKFGFPESFRYIGQGYIWLVPVPVIIMLVIFIFGWVILNKTRYGRYLYGIGGNEEACRLSGVNVQKIKYITYALSAALCGLAGVILTSRINSGTPKLGTGYELEIITAVVLGGVSIMGGEGKIGFVFIGVLIMGILSNGMILLDIQEYTQWIVKGSVLLLAVGFDRILSERSKKVALE